MNRQLSLTREISIKSFQSQNFRNLKFSSNLSLVKFFVYLHFEQWKVRLKYQPAYRIA